MNEWKLPYTFSRDYALMKRLLDEGYELVCYVTEFSMRSKMRNICRARKFEDQYTVSSSGIEYISYSERRKWGYSCLEEACAEADLEFIIPNQ